MDRTIDLLMVVTVMLVISTAVVIIFHTQSDDAISYIQDTQDQKGCELEAQRWSCGDEISTECIDYLDSEDQECAEQTQAEDLLT